MSALGKCALAPLIAAIGCGGGVAQGTGGQGATTSSSTASSTSSSSGGAGGGTFGECASDADCGGAPCVPLTPDGYGVCIVHVDPVTACGPLMGCCNSDLCPGESQCFPPFKYCGGLVGPQNKCLADECQVNEDCEAGHVCVPAGVFAYPVKTCMLAACRQNAECTAKPGGRCEPVEDTCCPGVFALYCVYPDGCRTKADCPPSAPICAGDPTTGAAACVTSDKAPQCPI